MRAQRQPAATIVLYDLTAGRHEASGQGEISTVPEVALQAPQATAEPVIDATGHENDNLPLAPRGHIVPAEPAGALAGTPLTDGKKPTKPAVGGAICGINQHRRPVLKVETASDDEPNARDLRGIVGPHDPGKRVAIDDTQRRDHQHRSLGEQFLGARCSSQEAKVGVTEAWRRSCEEPVKEPAHAFDSRPIAENPVARAVGTKAERLRRLVSRYNDPARTDLRRQTTGFSRGGASPVFFR